MPVQTKRKPLRVGFDLDGVLLYNPFCSLRPVTHALSHIKKSLNLPHSMFPNTHSQGLCGGSYITQVSMQQFLWTHFMYFVKKTTSNPMW
jgi:hypothetical protein